MNTEKQHYKDKEIPFELWEEYQLKLRSQYHKNPEFESHDCKLKEKGFCPCTR